MRLALAEAEKGWGYCSPNPMVGAVIVKNGELISSGYHQSAGQAHAEIAALQAAGTAAEGAELYVTLEPCSSWGKTPPCTDAIIKAKIKRTVIACLDKNPAHRGKAIEILRSAGIETQTGILNAEAELLNEHFFWWIKQKRPFVYLKMAMSLDGKIALQDGSSKWITGSCARIYVQKLRRLAGAIMVGGNTLRNDDSGLKVVEPPNWQKQPKPFIWTEKEIENKYKIMQGDEKPEICKPKTQQDWLCFLEMLGKNACNFLLLEGGGELAAAALHAGIVNKVGFFIAPKFILGRDSIPVTGGNGINSLADAIKISNMRTEVFAEDLLITGYCENVYRNS